MVRLSSVLYRVLAAAAVAAAVGCAQLAGIQDTNGNARPGASVAVTRMSVGSKIVLAPLDPGQLPATYFVASSDPSGFDRIPAVPDPVHGGWTTKLRAAAPVEFTLPDVPTPIPRLFAFPSPQLSVLYGVLEHPNPQAAPMGATFAVSATLDAPVAAGQSFQTYVVGAWLARGFSAAELPVPPSQQLGPLTIAFTAANSIPGRGQIDQVTPDDAFLILRYTGAALTGVAEAPAFAQTDMATTVPPATMTAVPQDQKLDVKITPATIAARYTKVAPAVATLQMSWSLVAAPGSSIASNTGPALLSGGVMMTDPGVSVSYGNPFVARGWNTIFTLATSESRVYAPMGPMGMPTPITLFAGMNQFFDPAHATDLELPAGLPQSITFGDVLLTSDIVTVKAPTKFVDVSFTVDTPMLSTGPAPSPTIYELQVFDLVVNSTATGLDRRFVLDAVSDAPKFALPPEVFQAGHSYSLRAIADLGGFPTVDQGNFLNRQLPLAQGYLDGGVVTVMP
ncbi:MAG TPA: hypothetical protein VF516_04885 [Kofleriaceae bacterium]